MADEEESERERRATNLELFLDLAFVFAVTQITSYVSTHLHWEGVGRGALLAWLVWWLWSQFAWAGSAVDLQDRAATRVLVLATIPLTLAMAAAIPESYGDDGAWFGGAYLAVQAMVLAMQAASSLGSAALRRGFARYASLAAIGPVVVLAGGIVGGNGQIVLWLMATAVGIGGALRGAGGEWVISPSHFAERHSLFVIISLGETLVAVGASASGSGLDLEIFFGLLSAAAMACVIWWTYFAFIPSVAERELRRAHGVDRGRIARDLFSFDHAAIVFGIVGFAVVAKHMVAHPDNTLPAADRVLLAASIALVISGYLYIQWRVIRWLAPERLGAIVAIGALCAFGGSIPGDALIAIAAALLLGTQVVTTRRFRAGPIAAELAGR